MNTRHFILYIPGLGDHYDYWRAFALWFWRIYGVRTQLIPMKWYEGGTYEDRVGYIRNAVEVAQAAGYKVSLVGESAGASMVLNVAAITPSLHCIVTIAGVNSSSMPISPITKKRSPIFGVSAASVTNSLKHVDTSRLHTIRALSDAIVPPRYNDIPGATTHKIVAFGHLTVIVLCLTALSFFVASLIKKTD